MRILRAILSYLKEDTLTPSPVGVLGALWGTALIKGDIQLLWNYDEEQEVKEIEARQNMNGHANKTADIKATKHKHLSIFERDRKSELVFIAVDLRSRDDGGE